MLMVEAILCELGLKAADFAGDGGVDFGVENAGEETGG